MAHKGIDLSHHNDGVDFGTAKRAGIEFVALKATEGIAYTDPTFHDRRTRARSVGFRHLLFYHFFRPDQDVQEQAYHFAAVVGTLQAGEAVVIDVEATDGWDKLTPQQSRDAIHDFVFHLKTALGLKAAQVILYGSVGWLRGQFKGTLDDLTFMPLWAARYRDLSSGVGDVSPWPKATIWQYSERASVPGAGNGDVDADVWLDEAGF